MIVRLSILALTLIILPSCSAVDGAISSRVNAINQSTEDAFNDAILTNIVRASQYRPLNFIGISKVGGTQTLDLTNGLPTITFGPSQTPLQHQLIFSNNSMKNGVSGSIDVGVLGTKDFYKGLLTPLSAVDINLLLGQGYPRKLIFSLVLESIKFKTFRASSSADNPELVRTFTNDPLNKTKNYEIFKLILEQAITGGISTEARDECNRKFDSSDKTNAAGARIVPAGRICFDDVLKGDGSKKDSSYQNKNTIKFFDKLLELEGNKNLRCGGKWARAQVFNTDEEKIEESEKEKKDGKVISKTTRTVAALCKMRNDEPSTPEMLSGAGIDLKLNRRTVLAFLDLMANDEYILLQLKELGLSLTELKSMVSEELVKDMNIGIELTTRSTYGIFVFLGKLLKRHESNKTANQYGTTGSIAYDEEILTITNNQVDGCFSRITYDSESYCIPSKGAENTKISFAILTQLLALKTAAGDLPITPTVRVTP